jgi:hypothetical protein
MDSQIATLLRSFLAARLAMTGFEVYMDSQIATLLRSFLVACLVRTSI